MEVDIKRVIVTFTLKLLRSLPLRQVGTKNDTVGASVMKSKLHTVGYVGVNFLYFDWIALLIPLQLKREPKPFPKLKIKRRITDIENFKYEDFEIVGYKPHLRIKMAMAVW